MGTCTLLLTFKLKDNARSKDLWPLVPDMLSLVLPDVTMLYPSNGLQTNHQILLVVAVGNDGRSQATLSYHRNQMLTLDVQHECSQEELVPMNEPYTMNNIRTVDSKLQELLGEWCERSFSLYAPIRRKARGPKSYTELGDDQLVESNFQKILHDVVSPFQRITIISSWQFGNVLLLDDDIMLGESDDIYTSTVLGLNRGNQFGGTKVLILGGGDGGLLNTLVSLPEPPSHVIMAEIDEEVMRACKTHMQLVCGSVLDTYSTPQYTILVRDCVEVLQESAQKGEQFDYVVNDLTELSVNKDKYGFAYDFKTTNIIMELSFRCLKEGGKYLARGNCSSCTPYVEKIERELEATGFPFQKYDLHVPSFQELYCFFESQKTGSSSSEKKGKGH